MTNPTYNLVDESWIPCVMCNDATTRLLSIRAALNLAPEIVEIDDPSPLVTAALYRLLLAILHRCYGPADAKEWRTLWSRRRFDEQVNTYLDQWKHRFDLFDPEYPFYQVHDIPVQYAKPIAQLAPELASGNNATLWDHTTHMSALAFTPEQAARYLIALQAFALGGLVSHRQDEKEHKSATGAPLAGSAVALVRGPTLWATLMLNLHRYDGQEEPFPTQTDDMPAWERNTATRPVARELTGYLDLLTWQSRQVQLYPEDNPPVVRHVAIMKGNQFPEVGYRHGKETMLAFRRNTEAKGEQDPWPAVAFREERDIWRDSLVLFQSLHNQRSRPRMLDWLALLVERGVLDDVQMALDLFGLGSDQAKPLFWRHERLPLPLKYLNEELLLEQVRISLQWAEQGKDMLNQGLRQLAERSIVPYRSLDGVSKDDRDRAKAIVKGWGAERQYWAHLDLPFRHFLEALPADYDPAGQLYGSRVMPQWTRVVRQAAHESFDEVAQGLDLTGRWLRAVALVEPAFMSRLRTVGIPEQAAVDGIAL
ncbi:MAG: type I-E CRISPR-associated protein Cse1/CasA [Herpetosiphonaceae bacterium]|nr:type I-E CRISPR-associated protein Cse1/CasA [Herpetosiphonaceae bacterium]